MNDIQFPAISVGGRDLVVRMSIAAQLLMSRRGLDIYQIAAELNPKMADPSGDPCVNCKGKSQDKPCVVCGGTGKLMVPNPHYVSNLLVTFSACVAENFINMDNPDRVDLNATPSADYWACQLHPLQFAEMQAKVMEALGKVSEARQAKLHVVAPPEAAAQAAS